MKKNILNSFLLLAVFIAAASCKAKKEVIKPVVSAETPITLSSKDEKITEIRKNQSDFTTMAIKAKADLSIDNNNNDVSMNIRIKKDQVIWVSVTAVAGLEVARAMITPDSVKILNRLDNIYIRKPFTYLYEFTNNQINFGTLQSILAGTTIKEFVNTDSEINVQGNQAVLSGVLKSLVYSMQLNERDKVVQTSLKDENAGQSLLVNYGNFISVSDQEIPHAVQVNSQAINKNIRIDLKYNRVDINGNVEIPFNVPKRFSVKD